MKPISKDTQLCISIAARPSNIGTTIMNAAFAHEGLDFIYKATKVGLDGLKGAIEGIRALDIRACGVSMPLKTPVMSYLDKIDPAARAIGAVNTIVNDGGKLTGYNTDSGSVVAVLHERRMKPQSILLLGTGGMAKATVYALKHAGIRNITIANRSV